MNNTDFNATNFSGTETSTEGNDDLSQRIWKYYPPFILVMGTIGNILCFSVTVRRPMRRSSVGLCLAFLAVADTVVLVVGLGRKYTIALTDWDIQETHESVCKLHRFLLYFGLDFSAWILVTVTIESYISVCYPFKANTMCALSRTKKVLIIVAISVTVENVLVFWARGREYETIGNNTEIKTECGYPGPDQKYYWRYVRPYYVIGLYALGPFMTMIICNICIVYRLSTAKKELKSRKVSYKMHSMAIMSVVIATVFLCLTTPSHLEFALEAYFDKEDPQQLSVFRLRESVTRMLLYTNHGINFPVYCASGARFRKEFIAMVMRKKKRNYAV